MVRSFRFALVAIALLILTEGVTLLVAAPVEAVQLPPVESLRVPGWLPGQIVVNSHYGGGVRFIQNYTALTSGAQAQVETRCSSDPKDFLKWTGQLGPEGIGYTLLHMSTARFAVPVSASSRSGDVSAMDATASLALMQNAGQKIVVLYAYLDHWGIHEQSNALYPRAIADLVTRHRPPSCMLGVTMFNAITEGQSAAEAQSIARVFLPVVDQRVQD
jgi:hypothetical protein